MQRAGWWPPRAANRFLGKADREAASVLSNAQRHTHFLDSPRIARVLSRSDFHFSELRHRITSVFLVLPPTEWTPTAAGCACWSSQALNDIARDAETAAVASSALSGPTERLKASHPALGGLPLFLLDEFAALGRVLRPWNAPWG